MHPVEQLTLGESRGLHPTEGDDGTVTRRLRWVVPLRERGAVPQGEFLENRVHKAGWVSSVGSES